MGRVGHMWETAIGIWFTHMFNILGFRFTLHLIHILIQFWVKIVFDLRIFFVYARPKIQIFEILFSENGPKKIIEQVIVCPR